MARFRRSAPTTSASLLLVALGTVAGLAIGMAVADRAGGLDGLLHREGSRRRRKHRDDGWRGDERRSQPFDALADDDSELAPEAISHLHLHGRHPEPSGAVREARHTAPRDTRRAGPPAPTPNPPRGAGAATAAVTTDIAPPRRAPDENELEERVLEAFRNDPILAERTIDIGGVGDGVIELTGWVEEPDEIAHAVTIARGVPDVKRVVALLAIRPE
jgi:hypothetical protein